MWKHWEGEIDCVEGRMEWDMILLCILPKFRIGKRGNLEFNKKKTSFVQFRSNNSPLRPQLKKTSATVPSPFTLKPRNQMTSPLYRGTLPPPLPTQPDQPRFEAPNHVAYPGSVQVTRAGPRHRERAQVRIQVFGGGIVPRRDCGVWGCGCGWGGEFGRFKGDVGKLSVP